MTVSCPRLDDAGAAAVLAAGGVLLLATDTVCGLHARADDRTALARLVELKGRRPEQPFLVLAAGARQALAMCGDLVPGARSLCEAAWPGPFTFILPAAPGLDDLVLDIGRRTVAIRVPGRADLRRLVERAGGPLASTSANVTGQPPLAGLDEAVAAFGNRVDGWWAGGDGEGPGVGTVLGTPSALVDLTFMPPRVLRPGPQPLPGGAGTP